MSKRRQALLGNSEPDQTGKTFIEMQDLDQIGFEKESNKYSKLEDEQDFKGKSKVAPSTYKDKPNMEKKSEAYVYRPPKPIVYNINNANNSIIRINSSGVSIQPQQPLMPPMLVNCKECGVQQQVAGNNTQFYCHSCKELNHCEPTFGMFVCGVCRHHVIYAYNLHELIQFNKVPLNHAALIAHHEQMKLEREIKKKQFQSKAAFKGESKPTQKQIQHKFDKEIGEQYIIPFEDDDDAQTELKPEQYISKK